MDLKFSALKNINSGCCSNTISTSSSSGNKKPDTVVVGTDADAPIAGETTWTLEKFRGNYVTLHLNYSRVNQKNTGNGSPYISKALNSPTLTIGNYTGGWQTGDVIDYTLE